jgi:hypothetical protein
MAVDLTLSNGGIQFADGSVQPTSGYTGFRNRLINGGMQVGQRGSIAFSGTNNLYGWVDRWLVSISGTTVSALGYQASSQPTSTTYALQVGNVTTTGATAVSVSQRIEVLNSLPLNGKTVTFSGKVYQGTGSAQTLTISGIKNSAGTPDVWSAPVTINSTTQSIPDSTWTNFSFTYAIGASDATNGLGVSLGYNSLSALSNKQFYFADCQLELGSTATAFEQRSYGFEFLLCQRYYQRIVVGTNGYSAGGQNCGGRVAFPVPMRIAPSATANDVGNTTAAATTIDSITSLSLRYYATTSGSGGFEVNCGTWLSAEL